MSTALDRDALYYPYIEIKNEDWLKATLLCFPHVRRIVPAGYSPFDSSSIRRFCDTEGMGGLPLLIGMHPEGGTCSSEQARLAQQIERNADVFSQHFSQAATLKRYPRGASKYRIYYLKLDYRLRECLLNHRLAWELEPEWYTLHPRLGRAVMATIAIAIANDNGLDIVTSESTIHRSVCTQRQSDVFDELTGHLRHESIGSSVELVDELASVFMTTYFKVSKLSIEQIVELQREGKDLRQFKNAILPIAQQIPDIPNREERERRLKDAAAQINSEWVQYKRSLPKFAADAIFDATEAKLPAAASAALGAATYLPFGVVAGIAVGVTCYSGWRMWQEYQKNLESPYQYLNRIHRAGATLLVPSRITPDK